MFVLCCMRYKYNMVFECLTADLKQVYGGVEGVFHLEPSSTFDIPNLFAFLMWRLRQTASLLLIHHLVLETERGDGDAFALRHRQHSRFTSEGQLFLQPRSDLLAAFGDSPHLQSSLAGEAVGLCKHHTCAVLLLFHSNVQNPAQSPSAHSQTLKKPCLRLIRVS